MKPHSSSARFLFGLVGPVLLIAGFGVSLGPEKAWAQEDEATQSLRTFGYIDHPAEPDGRRQKAGLQGKPGRRIAPGSTLITVIPEARAFLIDNDGRTLRRWSDPEAAAWPRAELLPSGDLLAVGIAPAPDGSRPGLRPGYLARYDWRGNRSWHRDLPVHHDVDVLPDGRIWTLGQHHREVDLGALGKRRLIDNTLLLLSSEGELLKELSLYDLVHSAPERFRPRRSAGFAGAVDRSGALDLLHTNAVAAMPFPELTGRDAIYCRSCVLVTFRHQDLVAVFDTERELLVWAWGPGELQFPHEGTWLENGRLLIFDNGSAKRGYSRIVELDPVRRAVTWTYRASNPRDFFTSGRGTAHALPNGNVLIASSNQSRISEVTRDGRLVWRYVVRGRNGKLVTMRARKYPPGRIPGLPVSAEGSPD